LLNIFRGRIRKRGLTRRENLRLPGARNFLGGVGQKEIVTANEAPSNETPSENQNERGGGFRADGEKGQSWRVEEATSFLLVGRWQTL